MSREPTSLYAASVNITVRSLKLLYRDESMADDSLTYPNDGSARMENACRNLHSKVILSASFTERSKRAVNVKIQQRLRSSTYARAVLPTPGGP